MNKIKNKIEELKNKEEAREEIKKELDAAAPSGEAFKLVVEYTSEDEDKNKTKVRLEAEALTAEDAIQQINLPKGITINVKVTLIKGSVEMLRSIPGFKARAIFENKKAEVLRATFRGLI